MAEPTAAPPQTISVAFNEFSVISGDTTQIMYAFVFNPMTLALTNLGGLDGTSYTINLSLSSNVGAVFEAFDPGTPEPPGYSVSGTGTKEMTVSFTNVGLGQDMTFNYEVTVNVPNGGPFKSADPEMTVPQPNG